MRLLLDTNFLLVPGRFRVDVFSELEKFGKPELWTIDLVVDELKKLRDRNSKLALELLKKNKVKVLRTEGSRTDREIEKLAKEKNFLVCTLDRELIKSLKKKGIGVITLRQKRYLVRT